MTILKMPMLQCDKCGEPCTHVQCGESLYCHSCEQDKIAKYYEENPVEPKQIFQEKYGGNYPKMYILVKDTIPLGLAMNAVGHSALACYLKFKDDPIMGEWLKTSFRKVTCKVTEEEFEKAKQRPEEHIVMTELTLDKAETAIAFKPAKGFHKFFKFLRLYK